MSLRSSSIAITTWFLLSGTATAHADFSHMTLGMNALSPMAFAEYCRRKPERCTPSDEVRRITFDDVTQRQLEAANRTINRFIAPLADVLGHDKPWQDDATIGDCVEFALAKRSHLLDSGMPSSALLLAEAVVADGEGHLVLVVVTDRGDFVLDNLRTSVVRWDELSYHWVRRSSPENPLYWQTIKSRDLPLVSSRLDDSPREIGLLPLLPARAPL